MDTDPLTHQYVFGIRSIRSSSPDPTVGDLLQWPASLPPKTTNTHPHADAIRRQPHDMYGSLISMIPDQKVDKKFHRKSIPWDYEAKSMQEKGHGTQKLKLPRRWQSEYDYQFMYFSMMKPVENKIPSKTFEEGETKTFPKGLIGRPDTFFATEVPKKEVKQEDRNEETDTMETMKTVGLEKGREDEKVEEKKEKKVKKKITKGKVQQQKVDVKVEDKSSSTRSKRSGERISRARRPASLNGKEKKELSTKEKKMKREKQQREIDKVELEEEVEVENEVDVPPPSEPLYDSDRYSEDSWVIVPREEIETPYQIESAPSDISESFETMRFVPARHTDLNPKYFKYLPQELVQSIQPAGVPTRRSRPTKECLEMFE
eukprot:TRINITY_DN1212_c0_g1_i1.p2 TRINITY_DN1212_c0_g1~~TRINITY_DN1212_c0_g1_i1.p2  ORF type:complete len:374 (-),score=110.87 TRINITY_DN1212_c0_g1_i1:86-1207(-)